MATTNYSEALDSLFKDHLDGKHARVSSKGLTVAGNIEGEVFFKYKKFFGLSLYAPVQWNSVKLFDDLKAEIFKNREELGWSYNHTDKLIPFLEKFFETAFTQAGTISPYDVVSWETTLRNGEIDSVIITYESGNKVHIHSIKK